MKHNLITCTNWILIHEGGYVNHPKDPGGATNKGVTQRVYDAYRTRKDKTLRSVKYIDDAEVIEIYKEQYWDKIAGNRLPSGADYAMYEFAINSGPVRAAKFAQEILGVTVDGVVGNVTIQAISDYGVQKFIQDLCHKRWKWLKTLRTYKTFGRGWTRRIMGNTIEGVQSDSADHDIGVIDRAVWLSSSFATEVPPPKPVDDGAGARTEVEDLKTSKRVEKSINIDNMGKAAGGAVPGMIAAATALPPGPLQWSASVVAVIAALAFAMIAYGHTCITCTSNFCFITKLFLLRH